MDIFLMVLLLNIFGTSVGGYGWGGGVEVHVHDLYISIVFITIIQPKLEIWSTVIKMDKEV